MANEEQLEILKKGTIAWNKWRDNNVGIRIDLHYVNLININLSEADLSEVDLYDANLSEANLSQCNLRGANLGRTKLIGTKFIAANLSKANFNEADLGKANLSLTDLSEADFKGANLHLTNFEGAKFRSTNFSGAKLQFNNFGKVDLREIKGLENLIHRAPSTIGTDTLAKSEGKIPEVFLKGCGLSDTDIEYAKLSNPDLSNEQINKILYKIYDLRASQAVQISPLFISYSHGDSVFVDKIENYLNKKGVRFWRDIHDATSGRLEKQIDRAMRLNSTVLLILSEHSLQSDWVEHEVRAARALEKEMKRDVLCPVALDDSWKNSPWAKRIMEQIMEYNILDFSDWKDNSKFEGTFNKLIDGLELFYK